MRGRHFGIVHLLMDFVHSGRKKSSCFFGGSDRCSTPVVSDVGLVFDYLDPEAGFSLVRGVSLAN